MYRFYYGNLIKTTKFQALKNKHLHNCGASFSYRIRLSEVQNWRCAYCGFLMDEHSSTIDHVTPRCRTQLEKEHVPNHVAACFFCNNSKGLQNPKAFYKKVQKIGIIAVMAMQQPKAYKRYKKFMIQQGYT